MNPIFEYFLKRVKKAAGIKSPSEEIARQGRAKYLSIVFQHVTRFKRPYALPYVIASWGLEYAPLSAAVCAYDNERFYHTDEPVSVLKGM